jgi:hypothetical protein
LIGCLKHRSQTLILTGCSLIGPLLNFCTIFNFPGMDPPLSTGKFNQLLLICHLLFINNKWIVVYVNACFYNMSWYVYILHSIIYTYISIIPLGNERRKKYAKSKKR